MSTTIKCERCHVTIAIKDLDMPNRCVDWQCPTMTYEFRMQRAVMLGMRADYLAKLDGKAIEALGNRALADLQAAVE